MASKVRIENGLVIGTSSDKYESKNPVARWLVKEFDKSVSELAALTNPSSILEVGCGEGHIVQLLLQATKARIHATDISPTCIEDARANVSSDRVTFSIENAMTIKRTTEVPDLVVCCEVLEHLDDPRKGLEALVSLGAEYYLLSVPREPIWRALNFLRGAYVRDWGNSPGHIQHWSKVGFLRFTRQYLTPILVRSPLPWTVVLYRRNET